MLSEFRVLEYLVIALVSLFVWVLKYRVSTIDKEIDILRAENSNMKSIYITSEGITTLIHHLENQMQKVEDNMNNRMTSLEKNISEKLDIYLRLAESKPNNKSR